MAFPSVTYTLANGAATDATQVNTNFTNLVSGFSDGTKDITMNAATFQTLTLSASTNLLSDLLPTDATYDLGSATKRFAEAYFTGPVTIARSYNANTVVLTLENTHAASTSSHAQFLIRTDVLGGDPYITWSLNGGSSDWAMGVDTSDSDAFVCSKNAALGTTNAFKIDTSRNMALYKAQLTLNQDATSAATTAIVTGIQNGALVVAADQSAGAGGVFKCYGSMHATKPGYLEFINGGGTIRAYMDSNGVLHADYGLGTIVSTANVNDTIPTAAEAISAFGAAATTGAGFIGIINDNNGDTNNYLVLGNGTSYYALKFTKLT